MIRSSPPYAQYGAMSSSDRSLVQITNGQVTQAIECQQLACDLHPESKLYELQLSHIKKYFYDWQIQQTQAILDAKRPKTFDRRKRSQHFMKKIFPFLVALLLIPHLSTAFYDPRPAHGSAVIRLEKPPVLTYTPFATMIRSTTGEKIGNEEEATPLELIILVGLPRVGRCVQPGLEDETALPF